jgi:hypothetical protein
MFMDVLLKEAGRALLVVIYIMTVEYIWQAKGFCKE